MKQTFTNNDLIKFIYKETNVFETLEIENALTEDAALFDNYQTLTMLKAVSFLFRKLTAFSILV